MKVSRKKQQPPQVTRKVPDFYELARLGLWAAGWIAAAAYEAIKHSGGGG